MMTDVSMIFICLKLMNYIETMTTVRILSLLSTKKPSGRFTEIINTVTNSPK